MSAVAQRHPYPWHVERAYMHMVTTRVASAHAVLAQLIEEAWQGWPPETVIDDALVSQGIRAVDFAAKGIRAVGPNMVELGGFAAQLDRWAKDQLQRDLPDTPRQPRQLMLETAWVQRGIDLIRNLDEVLIAAMKTALIEANGATIFQFGPVLEIARFDTRQDAERPNGRIVMTSGGPVIRRTPKEVAMARGRIIAQDQSGKGAGLFNKQAQHAAGITHYRWITQQDEKVRPEHARRHNKTFAWSRPPSDGHPGEPINCRCFARPETRVVRNRQGAPGRIRL